jgi:hypothetical protein
VATQLTGAVKQLAVVLRRYFVPVGNPPEMPSWRYRHKSVSHQHSPETYSGDELTVENRLAMSISHHALAQVFTMSESGRVLYFSSLMEDQLHPLTEEAIAAIPPLAQVAALLKDVKDGIESCDYPPQRLSYLFEKLCKEQWAERAGVGIDMEAGIGVAVWIQFHLQPIAEQFVTDLLQAADEAGMTTQPRVMDQDEDERQIVKLLESIGHRLTTDQILSEFSKRGQVKAESTTKLKLSTLIKKGSSGNFGK